MNPPLYPIYTDLPYCPPVPSSFPCSVEGVHRVLVATSDGCLHIGDIDHREGGDCKYHRELRLIGGEDLVSSWASRCVDVYVVL